LKGRCVDEIAWFTGIDLGWELPALRASGAGERLSSGVELVDAEGALSALFVPTALGLVAVVRDRLRILTVF